MTSKFRKASQQDNPMHSKRARLRQLQARLDNDDKTPRKGIPLRGKPSLPPTPWDKASPDEDNTDG